MKNCRTITIAAALLLLVGGCKQPERTLVIESEPAGALVYLNGEEVGRTPLRYDFTWYGDYDVTLRREGYETLNTHRKLKAPLRMWIPFDLITEMAGGKDRQSWRFAMEPTPETSADAQALFSRAAELRGELRSSRNTRTPTKFPTTLPAREAPATQPVTP
jgi:hypothetical protein